MDDLDKLTAANFGYRTTCINSHCFNDAAYNKMCADCSGTKIEVDSFKKFDQEKPQVGYLPFEQLEEVAKALDYGANKYGRNNWHNAPSIMKYVNASLRHIYAWQMGEDNDRESGLSHLAHAICSLLFLMWFLKHKKDIDDRK